MVPFRCSGEGHMKLEMARHPCLEVQDDVAFIANDIALERGKVKLKTLSCEIFRQSRLSAYRSLRLT